MTHGQTLTIVKPSFWDSRREIHDASGMPIAHFSFTSSWSYRNAKGDVRGKPYVLSYDGWDSRYAYMADASGLKIATIEPIGWWGTHNKLMYEGMEYTWKMNGWGTSYVLKQGDEEVMRVSGGGYFRPGTVTLHRPMDEKKLMPLLLFGIYQMRLYEQQVSAASAGSVVVISAT